MNEIIQQAALEIVNFWIANLARVSWERKRYTYEELEELMNNEPDIIERSDSLDDSNDTSPLNYPKGLTHSKWKRCCKLYDERKYDQYINVKEGILVKRNNKNKDAYCWKKEWCAPLIDKDLVIWAYRNGPSNKFESIDTEESISKDVMTKEELRLLKEKISEKKGWIQADTRRIIEKNSINEKNFIFRKGYAVNKKNIKLNKYLLDSIK